MHLDKKLLYGTVLSDLFTPILAALYLFGAPACTDGVLNSGADLGTPITLDSETATESDTAAVDDTASQPTCGIYGLQIPDVDICWYVSAPFQSCTELCEAHGGIHPDTPSHIGAESEGGNINRCNGILYMFRLLGYAIYVSNVSGPGLGCHHNNVTNANYWVGDVNFDPDAKAYNTQRICGCIGDEVPI